MNLKELKPGESAIVESTGGSGALRQHFLDMGLVPGVIVTLEQYAPFGDPMQLRIRGYALTLRLADAEKISITPIPRLTGKAEAEEERAARLRRREQKVKEAEHPGLGEGGRYHVQTGEAPWPEDKILTFALAGNQNSGKTTLFNRLTGANQHVGNFPGVTVDRKDGAIRGYPHTRITDLPGIYSLSPYSQEEIVTRQFILENRPDGIINIVDATNIERNLYLTMQLMELEVPLVLALNMMDELDSNGGFVRINEMEAALGIPVVPISAAKNEGIEELTNHAVHVAHYREKPGRNDFCSPAGSDAAVHRCLHAVMHLIEDHAQRAALPVRFAATKLIEGDPLVRKALALTQNEEETVEHIILQMEDERGIDRAAAIADMRFSFIENLVAHTVVKPAESREHKRSRHIDRILTGKYTALPAFVLIIALTFYLTFNVIGSSLQNALAALIGAAGEGAAHLFSLWDVPPAVRSLVLDGIFEGVGSVLSFLPIIVTLFFFLSMLEDTGYMARVAFVMDRGLRKIGLSGRSIVPMLIGFGCTVPAVMAGRTLPSARDRTLTILLTPFMSCSAKMPIYVFLTAAFFPHYGWLVMVCLYLGGIGAGIVTALISKNTVFKGDAVPFVMELPNYRMPGLKNVMRLLWDKARDFLERAFTVIFVATLIIWFLQNFDLHLRMTEDPENSLLARAAGFLAPVFAPIGFGDWRISTAIITGCMAKESVVSTLIVLFGGTDALHTVLTPLAALSLLVFCLLYTPCVAAIASIRRELGMRAAGGILVFQCVVAWICSFGVYMIGKIILP